MCVVCFCSFTLLLLLIIINVVYSIIKLKFFSMHNMWVSMRSVAYWVYSWCEWGCKEEVVPASYI